MNAAPSDNKRLCSIIVLLSQIATDSTEPSEKRQKETTQDKQQEKPFLYSITPSAPNPDDSATQTNPDENTMQTGSPMESHFQLFQERLGEFVSKYTTILQYVLSLPFNP